MSHAKFIVGKDCLFIYKGRICWLWKKIELKWAFLSLLIIHQVKIKEITFNTVKNVRMSDTMKKPQLFKTSIYPPDKWLYSKGILETNFPIHWIKFFQWIALSIHLLQNWGLYHKIYSELKPIHSSEILSKHHLKQIKPFSDRDISGQKRTKSSRPIRHLSFYISIIPWNLFWFQVANFYWN